MSEESLNSENGKKKEKIVINLDEAKIKAVSNTYSLYTSLEVDSTKQETPRESKVVSRSKEVDSVKSLKPELQKPIRKLLSTVSKEQVKKLINPSADIRLDVANSLWFDKNRFTFKDDYKKNVTNYYNAESNERNFSDPATVTAINNWASQNTNGKIPEVIKGIDKDVVGYLINAVYFKADWTEKFDKTQTELREFTLADGNKKNVMMMSDFRTYKYFNKARSSYPNPYDPTLGFEGIELTYGKEANVSLIMFLPDAKSSLEKFYSQLNEENLEKWLGGFYRNEGYISFPKFKNEWNRNISNNIRNMGIREAFSPLTAQFEKMGTSSLGNVYISKVLHNSYVDVNEEGTEAAAVTVIETAAASSAPTARFVADRPFFYIIRDNQTKSILFMGAVNDPKYEN